MEALSLPVRVPSELVLQSQSFVEVFVGLLLSGVRGIDSAQGSRVVALNLHALQHVQAVDASFQVCTLGRRLYVARCLHLCLLSLHFKLGVLEQWLLVVRLVQLNFLRSGIEGRFSLGHISLLLIQTVRGLRIKGLLRWQHSLLLQYPLHVVA